MKYCKQCKVNLNESLSHCPLCGSFPQEGGESFYASEVEPLIQYPLLKLKGDAYHNFLRKKSLLLVFVVVLVSVFINAIISPQAIWAAYVAISGVVVFLCLLESLYSHRRFYSLLTLYAFVLPGAVVGYDIVASLSSVGDLSAVFVSVSYICPAILLTLLILCTIMSFADKSGNKYYFTSTILISVFSLWPQITVWATGEQFEVWFPFALFCYALLTAALLSIIDRKRIAEELRRKFYI